MILRSHRMCLRRKIPGKDACPDVACLIFFRKLVSTAVVKITEEPELPTDRTQNTEHNTTQHYSTQHRFKSSQLIQHIIITVYEQIISYTSVKAKVYKR